MKMNKPTVGRVLLYYAHHGKSPLAATVAAVHDQDDTGHWRVNLGVWCADGSPHPDPPKHVPVVSEHPETGPYAMWPQVDNSPGHKAKGGKPK